MRSFLLGAKTVEGSFNIPFKVEKAPSWTNPYVTDGLVLQFDGIWNAGGGVHDPSPIVWSDISGNSRDGEIVGSVEWMEDCLIIKSNAENRNLIRFNGSDIGSAQTHEVVVMGVSYNSYSRITADGQSYPALIGFESGSYIYGYGKDGFVGNGQTLYDWQIANQIAFTHNSISDGGLLSFYVNGELKASEIRIGSESSGSNPAYLANRSDFGRGVGTGPYNGGVKFYAYRVYNRALTADEIAANYAVDKARFNLP